MSPEASKERSFNYCSGGLRHWLTQRAVRNAIETLGREDGRLDSDERAIGRDVPVEFICVGLLDPNPRTTVLWLALFLLEPRNNVARVLLSPT